MLKALISKAKYIQEFTAICETLIDTTKRKNADYTGDCDDPFFNFNLVEHATKGRIRAEDGIFTRMSDKYSRIESYLAKGSLQVKDESAFDTCVDLAVYSIILAILIRAKSKKPASDSKAARAK